MFDLSFFGDQVIVHLLIDLLLRLPNLSEQKIKDLMQLFILEMVLPCEKKLSSYFSTENNLLAYLSLISLFHLPN
jgi:hypothetical protein